MKSSTKHGSNQCSDHTSAGSGEAFVTSVTNQPIALDWSLVSIPAKRHRSEKTQANLFEHARAFAEGLAEKRPQN